MENYSIEIELESPELISVNEQYMHPVRKTKTGKYYSYFAPAPKLKKVQEYFRNELSEKIKDEDIEKLKIFVESSKGCGLKFTMILGLPEVDLREYDISNFIKSTEDCLVTRTGIDDSRHYRIEAEKRLFSSEDNHWMLTIILESIHLINY